MNILLLLIPLSLVLIGIAVWIFLWAVRRGQFEDLDTPALDILRDDEHEQSRRASNEGNGSVRAEAGDDDAD